MRTPIALALVILMVAVAGSGLVASPSEARDGRRSRDGDHERARQAFEAGEILPITRILELVSQRLPGDIVEVEVEVRGERMSYEVDVLTATGQVREIELDARTGEVIEIED
jgi:uncharacterized membrane protein YkoI